jgi:amino acid transporter
MSRPATLRRALNLPLLTCYGVGTIVGGGFYALAGKVAGEAGMCAPWAFLGASAVAALTACSFAELAARYPFSAGEARYVAEAFGRPRLAAAVGWGVIATGVVSAATLADAFAGFSRQYVVWPEPLVVGGLIFALAAIAAWGIRETAWASLAITALEVGGLVVLVAAGTPRLATLPQRWTELLPPPNWEAWTGMFAGAYLAFYAFIGFEDMVNVAEEVQRPSRTMPRAILLAVGVTTALYLAGSLVLTLSAEPADLAASSAPIAAALRDAPRLGHALTAVAMLAGLNGALVQIVMASRVAYGLAGSGHAPRRLARVHPRTRTPLEATCWIAVSALTLAWLFPLVRLARITSGILLTVFAMVHWSLWRIKGREPAAPPGCWAAPRWLALVGAGSCLLFVFGQLLTAW